MTSAIELSGVVRSFGSVRALDGLDLTVRNNEILGLLGPNGSGKTTLIRIIAGLLKANAGKVRVMGEDGQNRRRLATKIGYMTQSPALYEDLSVRENLVFFGRLYDLSRAEAARNAVELAALTSLDEKLDAPVRHLSGGMRQRTNLACALMHRPELLLLDEPTVGVDPKLRRSLWEHFHRLNEGGTTILVSTHIMDEVERCHRVAMIHQGRTIAIGPPDELCRAVVCWA